LEHFEDASPVAEMRPASELVVDSFPGAEALWQIAPGNACLRAIQHSVDEIPVAEPGLQASTTRRQRELHEGPLLVRQRMAVVRHAAGGSPGAEFGKGELHQIEMIQEFLGTPPSTVASKDGVL